MWLANNWTVVLVCLYFYVSYIFSICNDTCSVLETYKQLSVNEEITLRKEFLLFNIKLNPAVVYMRIGSYIHTSKLNVPGTIP